MSTSNTPDPDDVADLVALCDNLDGAGALASDLARLVLAAEPTGELAHVLHGLSEAEATGLATILDRLRA